LEGIYDSSIPLDYRSFSTLSRQGILSGAGQTRSENMWGIPNQGVAVWVAYSGNSSFSSGLPNWPRFS
ncbi:MAG: hypothetical protein WC091_21445, partial [Sulfuricellaceae bacterium]